jgi:predicted GNAT family N-acyltransferase
MRHSVEVAQKHGAKTVEIEAQCYAIPFYEKVGFIVSSDEFMLDGIPHKRMILQL